MYRHYIVLSSSYKQGMRIALDFPIKDGARTDDVMRGIDSIQKCCGAGTFLSIHTVITETPEWQSVIKADSFFDDVKFFDDLNDFISTIKESKTLCGLDIARYILGRVECTHLKLEKLVYLCYAEYLCRTGKKLFEDRIFAFKYGPVVSSVYEYYKTFGAMNIDEEDEKIPSIKNRQMSSKSRILFSEDGLEKIDCIDETLKYYGDLTAIQLVDLTHLQDTPWNKTYNGGFYEKISDDCIKKYHKNER